MRVRDGAMLVGGRISVDGYGPGSVVGFNKNYGPGASSHEIRFDQGAPHGLFVLLWRAAGQSDPVEIESACCCAGLLARGRGW